MATESQTLHDRYELGDLILDAARRRVERRGAPITLNTLSFDLLRALVVAAPEPVTYDQLALTVWKRQFVSQEAIAQRIKLLRQSLGEDGVRPRYIEAVRGRGYRLIAETRVLEATEALRRPWLRRARRIGGVMALVGAAAVTLASDVWHAPTEPVEPAAPVQRRPSVAVLPLSMLGADADRADFVAGLHAEILNQLAQIKALDTVSQRSVMRYQDSRASTAEIARELGVDAVVEGSVAFDGDRVVVQAALIDAATDRYLWSHSYPRELGDVFTAQADIAVNVANALMAELSVAERERIEQPPTDSPEAYAAYLHAVGILFGVSVSDPRILGLLTKAVELDPEFAIAHALLAGFEAHALIDAANQSAAPRERQIELERSARERAQRALALDPNVRFAHTALAELDFFTWRWTSAADGFRRALETAPNEFVALGLYSWLSAYRGEDAEALAFARRTVELNPNVGDAHRAQGIVLAFVGNYDAAAASLRTARELMPTDPFTTVWSGHIEVARGHESEALQFLQLAEQLLTGNRVRAFLPELAYAYSRLGRRDDALRLFRELEAAEQAGAPIGAGTWAMANVAIGDYERAAAWLEVAARKAANHEADEGFYALMFLRMNVLGDPVLEQPRFADVLNRIKGT